MNRKRKLRLFMCGPLTCGDTLLVTEYAENIEKFRLTAAWLRRLGYEVWSPVEGLRKKNLTHKQFMRRSLNELTRKGRGEKPYYDAIYALKGSFKSKGAQAEIFVGKMIGVELAVFPVV